MTTRLIVAAKTFVSEQLQPILGGTLTFDSVRADIRGDGLEASIVVIITALRLK